MEDFVLRQIPSLRILLGIGLFYGFAELLDPNGRLTFAAYMLLFWFVCDAACGPLVNITSSTTRFVARQVTAMFSTEQEAKALAAELAAFARGQSILVAPFSGEDERRIAALGAGERAMQSAIGAPPDSAAQIERQLYTAAALGSAPPPPAPGATAGRRFCRMCGVEAPAGARFCAACAAPLDG